MSPWSDFFKELLAVQPISAVGCLDALPWVRLTIKVFKACKCAQVLLLLHDVRETLWRRGELELSSGVA